MKDLVTKRMGRKFRRGAPGGVEALICRGCLSDRQVRTAQTLLAAVTGRGASPMANVDIARRLTGAHCGVPTLHPVERKTELSIIYDRWLAARQGAPLSAESFADLLTGRRSFAMVDQAYRRRKGWARTEFVGELDRIATGFSGKDQQERKYQLDTKG